MSETVTAVYEKGVLRPLQPLNLQEQQRVRIQVLPDEPVTKGDPGAEAEVSAAKETSVDELVQRLVAKGWMRPRPKPEDVPPDPVAAEERLRLADKLGRAPGKPLSEIIIGERGER